MAIAPGMRPVPEPPTAPAGKKEKTQYTKGGSVNENVYDDDNASTSLRIPPVFNKVCFTNRRMITCSVFVIHFSIYSVSLFYQLYIVVVVV